MRQFQERFQQSKFIKDLESGWMDRVTRKSRKKSLCFSSTVTSILSVPEDSRAPCPQAHHPPRNKSFPESQAPRSITSVFSTRSISSMLDDRNLDLPDPAPLENVTKVATQFIRELLRPCLWRVHEHGRSRPKNPACKQRWRNSRHRSLGRSPCKPV